ncbi:MAG: AAA domain-containing protein, partial [Pirellulaceae bacterium]
LIWEQHIIDSEQYFQKLAHWLGLESRAEALRLAERRQARSHADVERRGETLLDLVIEDDRVGLGGRVLLTLVKKENPQVLPWNRFRVGTPVVLSSTSKAQLDACQGVVSGRDGRSIEVAFDRWPDGNLFRLDISPDEVTRRRQLSAMQSARMGHGRLGTLRQIVLGERQPQFGQLPDVRFFAKLNESQQRAVCFAMSARDLALVHGPPGTGKTTTVVEIIRQAIAGGDKVLATAPSNTAVDNLLERLVAAKQNVVRIGHPARVLETLQTHTLDVLVEQDPAMRVVAEMYREAEKLFQKADRFSRSRPAQGVKQAWREEAKQLQRDARMYEQRIVDAILSSADVVCATTTTDPAIIRDMHFHLVVIDEACQTTEAGCWMPLLHGERVVFAGDHCQLPPTVLSAEAAREGFAVSMMERLVHEYGADITRRLTVQYRMHEEIMQFSSEQFYDSELVADESVRHHRLVDLPHVGANEVTEPTVTFIDTAGAGWQEELEPEGRSKRNPAEGRLVLKKVERLLDAGLCAKEIAVIAPYAAQVRWLRAHCSDRELEIDTVDGFQGREKEAVIICLVRSNEIGEIGFLADTRRMNVALTRARRSLTVIGDSATLAVHPFYREMIDYMESIGAYQSVWQEGEV